MRLCYKAFMDKEVTLPASLFEKFVRASEALDEFTGDMEDFLLSKDSTFLARMREARRSHLKGRVRPLKDLKTSLCGK